MENNTFKTVAFGGFDKQNVIQYIEHTARENAEIQNRLTEENDALREAMDAAEKELTEVRGQMEQLADQQERLLQELEKERSARLELEGLTGEVERLRVENEQLRPDADAYARFQNRLGAIECEARKRAADLEAETVAQLHRTLDLFQTQYQALMDTFETASAHVTGELRKVEVNLSHLPRAMDRPGAELRELAAILEKQPGEAK